MGPRRVTNPPASISASWTCALVSPMHLILAGLSPLGKCRTRRRQNTQPIKLSPFRFWSLASVRAAAGRSQSGGENMGNGAQGGTEVQFRDLQIRGWGST